MKPDHKRELITGEVRDSRGRVIGIESEPIDPKTDMIKPLDIPSTDVIPPTSQLSSREISNKNLAPRWGKGMSGNPAGGKKKERCITLILRELLGTVDEETGKTWERQIAETMVRKAASMDSTKGTASVLKEVLERVEGKVPDQLQIESHNVSIEYIPAKYMD